MGITAIPYTAVLAVPASRLLGNDNGTTGPAEALTAAEVRTLLSVYTTTEVDTLLSGKAATVHVHAASDITSGTLDIARIPTGTTSTTVCIGNDSRLSDARTPTAHKASHAAGGTDALAASDIGAVPTSRQLTINGTAYDLSTDRSWTVSGGITTLNTLTTATQTFAVGTTGTNFAISSAAGVHTFNLPDASATARGVVSTGDQTFAGDKTFANVISSGYVQAGSTAPRVRFTQNGISNFNGGTQYNVISWTGGNVIEAITITGYAYQGLNIQRAPGNETWITVNYGVAATGASGSTPRQALDVRGNAIVSGNLQTQKGATPTLVEVYNTYTSNTSYERLGISWASNVCTIDTEKGSAGGTLRGFRIGGASTSLIGFWGATPISQPTTAVASATRVGGGGTALTDTDTFDGYTISQFVRAMRLAGLIQ